VPCRVVSCRVVSCRAVSGRAVLCRVVPCRFVLCRVVSCRAMSCRVISPSARALDVSAAVPTFQSVFLLFLFLFLSFLYNSLPAIVVVLLLNCSITIIIVPFVDT
jgi:hypothetical protein